MKKISHNYVVIIIMILISSYLLVTRGVHYDERMITFQELRYLKGDIPLKDVWGPYAVSTWFTYEIIKPIYLLFGRSYWILIGNILCILCAGILSFVLFKSSVSRIQDRIYASMVFFCFLPSYLYSFLCHYTVSYYLTLISILLMERAVVKKEGDTAGRYLCFAIMGVIAVLKTAAMPTMVFVVPVEMLYIFCERSKNNKHIRLLSYTFGLVTTGVVLAAVMFMKGIEMDDLLNINSGYMHSSDGISEFLRRGAVFVGVICFVIVWHIFFRRLSKKLRLLETGEFTVFVYILGALFLLVNVIVHNTVMLMRSGYAVIIILGMWVVLIGIKDVKNESCLKIFRLYVIYGVSLAGIVGIFTNTGAMVTAMGFLLPIVGYMIYAERESMISLGGGQKSIKQTLSFVKKE